MAAMAALADASHCSVGMLLGSFMSPRMTWSLLLYFRARRRQKSANAESGTAAEPIRLPA
jgi:hypothetical protein